MRIKPKLKRGTKGHRWKKGQSSSSNPVCTKHREAARLKSFPFEQRKQIKGNSLLTRKALEIHDAKELCKDDNISQESISESGNTCLSYVSKLSETSTVCFNRFFKNFQMNSALHKEMLAILAALDEVITEKTCKSSEMATIEAIDNENTLTAAVALLYMCLQHLPSPILKSIFLKTSKYFSEQLTTHYLSNNGILLKNAQTLAVWQSSSTLHSARTLLLFIHHPKPKVRKAVQEVVVNILEADNLSEMQNMPKSHPFTDTVINYICYEIETKAVLEEKTTISLHLLNLLKLICHTLSSCHLKNVCETILKILSLGNVLVNNCCLEVLHTFFLSHPSSSKCLPSLNSKILTALYDFMPNINHSQPLKAWLAVMQEGVFNLCRIDTSLGEWHMLKLVQCCIDCWLSEKPDVCHESTNVLQFILHGCLPQLLPDSKPSLSENLLLNLQEGFKFSFQPVWGDVLSVIGTVFKFVGEKVVALVQKCLRILADLRSALDTVQILALERAFGFAISSIGPEAVLKAVPLSISGTSSDDPHFPYAWLIPVFRDNIFKSEIHFFLTYFIPLASSCKNYSKHHDESKNTILSQAYNQLYFQIWSLLPAFCRHPVDLPEQFENLTKLLALTFDDEPFLRLVILKAFGQLLPLHGSLFPSQFMPLFLKYFYCQEIDQSTHILIAHIIGLYLKHFDTASIEVLSEEVLTSLKNSEIEPFIIDASLEICCLLVEYCSDLYLSQFWSHCKIFLPGAKHGKKAYKLFVSLLSSKSNSCQMFCKSIIDELVQCLFELSSTVAPKLITARLMCILNLLQFCIDKENCREVVHMFFPEIIIYLSSVFKKQRGTALSCLKVVITHLKEQNIDEINDIIKKALAGLSGTNLTVCSSLVSLGYIVKLLNQHIPVELIDALFGSIMHFLKSSSRPIVKSCLTFMHLVLFSIPSKKIASYLPDLMKTLSEMDSDCSQHFRLKIRYFLSHLMHLYGYGTLKLLVPPEAKLLAVCLKNIYKMQISKKNRKNRLNKSGSNKEYCLKDKPTFRKFDNTNIYIEEDPENFVDLLSPSVMKTVHEVKHRENETEVSFPIAADGRLIIANVQEKVDDHIPVSCNNKLDEKSDKLNLLKKRRWDQSAENEMVFEHKAAKMSREIKKITPNKSDFGEQYKARNAGGDIKKKGLPNPYAYIPLNREILNKRKRAKFSGQFKGLLKKKQMHVSTMNVKFRSKRKR